MALLAPSRAKEAGMMIEKAEEADPLSPVVLHNSGLNDLNHGSEEAFEKWDRGIEVSPEFDRFHLDKATVYAMKSMRNEALAELELLDSISNQSKQARVTAAFLYRALEEKDEADRRFESLLIEAKGAPSPAGLMVWLYAGLQDADKLYEWAFKPVEERSFQPNWLRTYPLFEKLRSDLRYREFLRLYKVPC